MHIGLDNNTSTITVRIHFFCSVHIDPFFFFFSFSITTTPPQKKKFCRWWPSLRVPASEWAARARRIRDPGVDTCGPRAISALYGVMKRGERTTRWRFFFLGYTRRRKNTNWAGNSIHLVTIINKSGHLFFFLSLCVCLSLSNLYSFYLHHTLDRPLLLGLSKWNFICVSCKISFFFFSFVFKREIDDCEATERDRLLGTNRNHNFQITIVVRNDWL